MIEYIYDAIRVSSGTGFTIEAEVKTADNVLITDNVRLYISNGKKVIAKVDGDFYDDIWHFNVSEEATAGLEGRYFYCIRKGNEPLCFREPIYFI